MSGSKIIAIVGVACLSMVIRYFDGASRLERLRELSGTSKTGTTLLGLYQAAPKLGLKAGAFEADIKHLKELKNPCILHIEKKIGRKDSVDNSIQGQILQHYIVCFGYDGEHFIIGDPGDRIDFWSPDDVEKVWQSKALLLLEPDKSFISAKSRKQDQWHWLKKLIDEDLNILGLALGLGLMISLLNLSTAVFSQKLIDNILPARDQLRLFTGLSLLLFLLLVRNGLSFIRRKFLIGQSRDFNNRVIGYFYRTILHLPQSFFDTRETGDLVARMNDINHLQQAITHLSGALMIQALIVISSLVLVFYYAPLVGWFLVFSIPVFGWITWRYQRSILKGQRDVMQAQALNASNYIDTIQGITTIKTSNRESWFSKLTERIYHFYQKTIYKLGNIGVGFNFWVETSSVLFLVGGLTISSILILKGELLTGALVAILQMMGQLLSGIRQLVTTNIQLQGARVAYERMYEYTSLKPEYDLNQDQNKKS